MNTYALALFLLGSTSQLDSGCLLVLEGHNKPVRAFTGSSVTHVALVMNSTKRYPMVYEAAPGRVRCVSLDKYLAEIRRFNAARRKKTSVWVMRPKRPYSRQQLTRMQSYLDSQLGRRYSVKGYVRKRPTDGIHCAEFASTALMCTGRFQFRERYRLSPGELIEQIESRHDGPYRVKLPTRQPSPSWPKRTWHRWLDFQSWCLWAYWEAFRFCW